MCKYSHVLLQHTNVCFRCAICICTCVHRCSVLVCVLLCFVMGVAECVAMCNAVCVADCVAGYVAVCSALCTAICVAGWFHVLRRSAGEIIIMMISHCNSLLQCVAARCHMLHCTASSPCTTCRVQSLPTHALLPLAVYPRLPLPRRQRHARCRLQCRGSCNRRCERT